MKSIGSFLDKKKLSAHKGPIDEKSLFYVFSKVIRDEYGNRGIENLKADFFKDKKLFIKANSSNWANEVWMNRRSLVEKINMEIGSEEVKEISI